MAAAMKKKGVGIFAPKKLSDALAAVCGVKTAPRTEVTKKIWAYIKKLAAALSSSPERQAGRPNVGGLGFGSTNRDFGSKAVHLWFE